MTGGRRRRLSLGWRILIGFAIFLAFVWVSSQTLVPK